MDGDLQVLVLTLHEIGAVRFGQFTLHSGRKSPIYIDLRLLVSYPAALRQVAWAYRPLLLPLTFDLLAAYPYAALPIGTAIALEMGIPLIYPRKEVKSYGTGRPIEGKWRVGQRAVLIEDLVTSGESIAQAMASLKAAGILIRDAVVLIDRQQGGKAALAAQGYALQAVLTLSNMLAILEEAGRITSRQRARVLATIEEDG